MSAENRNPRANDSPVPSKRNSIEKLKQASRVKNSTMFAREQKQEYDPTASPLVERPLAAGRPLSAQAQRSQYDSKPENKLENKVSSSPLKGKPMLPPSDPQKTPQGSPGKSSLSKNSRYGRAFDPENGVWSEDDDSFADRQLPAGKSLHRHAKSVTFDAAPPEINEYEMATPDPSSVASGSREGSYDSMQDDDDDDSMDRGSSMDRDDSFDASLEDTDKTPVVLPEDWRFMSPGLDGNELTAHLEDPFILDSSPVPEINRTASLARTNSVNSNGERRPLPPLPPPGMISTSQSSSDSSSGLQEAGKRASLSQRNLPSPPMPPSISKLELQGMGSSSMSLEDRLRLMMLQEEENPETAKTAAEEQRERRMRRGTASPDRPTGRRDTEIKIHEDEPEEDAAEEDYELPKKVSRDSILKKVEGHNFRDDFDYSSPAPSSSPERPYVADVDPDTPLPSLEERCVVADDGVIIKREEDEESEVDVYAIPDMYHQQAPASNIQAGFDFGLEKNSEQQAGDTDDESHYSTDMNGLAVTTGVVSAPEDEGPPTPRAEQPLASQEEKKELKKHRLSLSQFASMLGDDDDFGMSMSSYMTPSPPVSEPLKADNASVPSAQNTYAPIPIERPVTPVQQMSPEPEEPSTPESVIRRSISPLTDSESSEPELEPELPVIPEPSATIKAPGGGLKTRASLAPADVEQMAQVRRKVSGENPPVPPIPDRNHKRPSVILEGDSMMIEDGEDCARQNRRKSGLVQLDIPVDELDEGLSFGIDKEFDRLIEAQKVAYDPFPSSVDFFSSEVRGSRYHGHLTNISTRTQKGYLMRQNTKVVVASSASHDSSTDLPAPKERMTKSAGNSPVKQGQAGTWTTEPWNGKIRRKSIRQSAGSPMKRPAPGAVPPLPGMPSAVTQSVENQADEHAVETDEFDESGERGRLFVKVVGVKDLDLPLPRG